MQHPSLDGTPELHWRRLPVPLRVLLINHFGFNLGFFMMLPYLAGHLSGNLGQATWQVGLVLGVRTFSQQGLFLIGGIAADHFGYRGVILAGSLVRTAGFLAFTVATDLPDLLLAAALSGFGGALFTPACHAYVALEAGEGDRQRRLFALQHVFVSAGMLLGPLAGLLFLWWDFRAASAAAATVFLAMSIAQWVWLPPRRGKATEAGTGLRQTALWLARDREFQRLTLIATSYFLLVHQIYLAVPMAVQQATGNSNIIAAIFLLAAVIGITAQMPLSDLANRHFAPRTTVALGILLGGASFLPMIAYAHPLAGAVAYLPAAVTVSLLTVGSLVAFPVIKQMVVASAAGRPIGAYIGCFYLAGGIAATLGNTLTGLVFDWARQLGMPALPWLLLAAVGAFGSMGFLLGAPKATRDRHLFKGML